MPPKARAAGRLTRAEVAPLTPGRPVFLKYLGEDFWHKRVLAARGATPRLWIVITPALDVHEEDVLDPEVIGYASDPRRGVPVRLRQGQALFRFNEEELEEHVAELEAEA
eukprot:10194185-Heterocapsa_arctica.AAC.1